MLNKIGFRYHRFSNKDQSNGSIERQDLITAYWCKNNNVVVQDTFNDDGFSAKTFDRPDIKKLFAFINQNAKHRRIDYLIVAELSRFSRDLGEAVTMIKKIQMQLGIRIVSASRNMIYDVQDPTSFFMMSIEFTLGNTENLKRESDINGGIYTAKTKGGRFIGSKAPFGYKKEGQDKNRNLVIDEEQSTIVRYVFDSYLKGIPFNQIYQNIRKQGYPYTGNSKVQNILTNPIYIAHQNVKSYKEHPGGLFPANFEPIIDQLTWNQVQHALKRTARPGISINSEIPLRGVLHCHCGRLLTGAPSRGKMGNYYYYYKCATSSKHNNISATFAHKQLDEAFKYMSLSPDAVEDIRDESLKEMEIEVKEGKKRLGKIQADLAQVEQKIHSLEEKWINNQVSFETYNRWFTDYRNQRSSLSLQIDNLSKADNEIFSLLDKNLYSLTDMSFVYQSFDTEGKQELIRKVFDNRLYYKEKVYRTPHLMEIFHHNILILKQKQLLVLDEKRDFLAKVPLGGAAGSRTCQLVI